MAKSISDLLTEYLTGYPLAELDLDKDPNNLRKLRDSSGNIVHIHPFNDVYEQFSHIDSKIDSRFLPEPVRYLLTSTTNYLDHIKEILELNFESGVLYDKMLRAFHEDLSFFCHVDRIDDIVNYDDDLDTQFKLSTYRICSFEDKLFMIEGAVGTSITPVIYKSKPVFKRFRDDIMRDEIIEKNSNFENGHGLIDISNIDAYRKPVLNICGYATWVKFINNIEDRTFIQSNRLGQKNLPDLYIDRSYPDRKYEVEIANPKGILKEEYDILMDFEKHRKKNK